MVGKHPLETYPKPNTLQAGNVASWYINSHEFIANDICPDIKTQLYKNISRVLFLLFFALPFKPTS